jgi:hypothetical protein
MRRRLEDSCAAGWRAAGPTGLFMTRTRHPPHLGRGAAGVLSGRHRAAFASSARARSHPNAYKSTRSVAPRLWASPPAFRPKAARTARSIRSRDPARPRVQNHPGAITVRRETTSQMPDRGFRSSTDHGLDGRIRLQHVRPSPWTGVTGSAAAPQQRRSHPRKSCEDPRPHTGVAGSGRAKLREMSNVPAPFRSPCVWRPSDDARGGRDGVRRQLEA